MEDKSIFELIAEYSAGTISPVDAELLRERLESDVDAMRLFREIRESEKMLKSVQACLLYTSPCRCWGPR